MLVDVARSDGTACNVSHLDHGVFVLSEVGEQTTYVYGLNATFRLA